MSLEAFHPVLHDWFVGKFRAPTDPQRLGWPSILADRHTLIAAPLRPIQLPPEVYEYLSPRKRVTYYFDADSRKGRTQ